MTATAQATRLREQSFQETGKSQQQAVPRLLIFNVMYDACEQVIYVAGKFTHILFAACQKTLPHAGPAGAINVSRQWLPAGV